MSLENKDSSAIIPFIKEEISICKIDNVELQNCAENIVVIDGVEYVKYGKLLIVKSFRLKHIAPTTNNTNDMYQINTNSENMIKSNKILISNKKYFMLNEIGFIIEVNENDIPEEFKNHKNYKRYLDFLTKANNAFGDAFSYPKFTIDQINDANKTKILRVCRICRTEDVVLIQNHCKYSGCNRCDKSQKILNKLEKANIDIDKNMIVKPLFDDTCCKTCNDKYKVIIKIDKTRGCLLCNVKWPLTPNVYEEIAILVHGDKYTRPGLDKIIEIKSNTKIPRKCKDCGTVRTPQARQHLRSQANCIECLTWTYDKLMKFININNRNVKCISKPEAIKGIYSPFTLLCKKDGCGYSWETNISKFINTKTDCLLCQDKEPWKGNIAKFLRKGKDKFGDKFTYGLIKPEYLQSVTSKVPIICNDCNYFFVTTIQSHFSQSTTVGCSFCSNSIPWTYDRFIKEAKLLHNDLYEYTEVEEIKNSSSVIKIKCKKIGHEWLSSVNNHINHEAGCRQCVDLDKTLFTFDYLVKKTVEVHGDVYYLDPNEENNINIKNSKSRATVKCLRKNKNGDTCGKKFHPVISHFIHHGSGCPSCKKSHGERNCVIYLKQEGIVFNEQVKLLATGDKLFDFEIDYNDTKFYLEFDGLQHFRYTLFFDKTYEQFLKKQERDIMKTRAAMEVGNIIRIDYSQIDNVGYHINKALTENRHYYFSDEILYNHIIEALNLSKLIFIIFDKY